MSRPVGRSAALCCLVSCSAPSHAPDCMNLLALVLDRLVTRQSVTWSFKTSWGACTELVSIALSMPWHLNLAH